MEGKRALARLSGIAARCAEDADDDEAYLAALAKALPGGMALEGDAVSWSHTDGLRTLACAVEVAPLSEAPRLSWKIHRLTALTEEAWN